MFNILRTRRGKLKEKLTYELDKRNPDINKMLLFVDEFERANLDTIIKLKRKRTLEMKRINGALKQTINAHGPITGEFINSATKRIYGSLLEDEKNNKNFFARVLNFFK